MKEEITIFAVVPGLNLKIEEHEAQPTDDPNTVIVGTFQRIVKPFWFTSREEAEAEAERQREKELKRCAMQRKRMIEMHIEALARLDRETEELRSRKL